MASGLVAELAAIVGPKGVLTAEPDMARYLEDWWGRARGAARCVVLPGSTEEVSQVVRLCHARGVPVFPQGGNTSTVYGAIPHATPDGIVLGLGRMGAVLDVDARDNSITVQAGCILATVQQAAAAVDRLYPLSLGAEGSCQIGGTIATNAGGTGVLRYGNTRDLVLGLEVVLPDGRIWHGLRSLRKNNSGYDLKHLFIGAEGSLGIVTAATLKLFPRLPNVTTALLALRSVQDALDVGLLLAAAFPGGLTALELLSASELKLVTRLVPGVTAPLPLDAPWFLLVDIASIDAPEHINETLAARLEQPLGEGAVMDVVVATSEAQRAAVWKIRHSVTESHKKYGVGMSHDVAVPLAAIPRFVEAAGAIAAARFPEGEVFVVGHLGDGNLHYNILFAHGAWADLPDQAGTRREVYQAIYDLAAECRGTFSAEHGIGALHVAEMARYKDPVELEMMRGIKQLFDPAGLFNPGRVLPGPPGTG